MDSRSAIFDHQGASQLIFRQPGFHIVQNICRFLVPRVIARQDQLLTTLLGNLRHHRPFALVSVSAATNNRNEFLLSFVHCPLSIVQNLPYGTYHIINSVRRVSIIDYRRPPFRTADRLKTTVHRFQCTENTQHLQLLKAQTQSRTVDTEQVAHIESSYQRHEHLFPIDIQHHPIKTLFQDLRLVIRQRTGRIGLHIRLAVLRHDESVLVIFVRHRESCLLQSVKQPFLRIAVVVKSLMVVYMIPRQVGKQRSVKVQTGYTFLRNRVRTNFHKRVLATCIHHPSQQTVQFDRVRRRMSCRNRLVLDIIDHGRKQSCLVSQSTHEFVQQGRNSRLAVRSCHAHKRQRLTRLAKPLACQQSQRLIRILNKDIGHVLRIVHECTITQNDRNRAFLHTTINERVSIYCRSHLRNEQIALTHLTAVKMQTLDLFLCRTDHLYRLNRCQ